MAKTGSHVRKYYYAVGYHHGATDGSASEELLVFNCPSSELADYYRDLFNVEILNDYKDGYDQGKKDRINGLV